MQGVLPVQLQGCLRQRSASATVHCPACTEQPATLLNEIAAELDLQFQRNNNNKPFASG